MSKSYHQTFEWEDVGDAAIVKFATKKLLTEETIRTVGEGLGVLVEDGRRRKLILNFSNIEYLSTAAIGMLINLNNKMRANGGVLRVSNLDPGICDLLKIVGFRDDDDNLGAVPSPLKPSPSGGQAKVRRPEPPSE